MGGCIDGWTDRYPTASASVVKPCYSRRPEELNNRLKLENRSYQRRALLVGGQGKCTHLNRERGDRSYQDA